MRISSKDDDAGRAMIELAGHSVARDTERARAQLSLWDIHDGSMIFPDHAYIVCSTQRSGSTYMCRLLASTEVAGNPHGVL